MMGMFAPSDSALLLIDHQVGTMKLIKNIQGPLLPELQGILPEAFAARIKRAGIVNAWNDPNFKAAVEKTQRRNLIMAGVTTDVCLIFPAISACREGYQVQAVMDASGSPSCSKTCYPASSNETPA